MIANSIEARVAAKSLQTFTKAPELLRLDLKDTNPSLFPIVSQTYLRRIRDLQADILTYYAAHETKYNQPDPELAETIREPVAEYEGQFVTDNDKLPDNVGEAKREVGSNGSTSEPLNTVRAEGIRIGVRKGKLEIMFRMINNRFGSISAQLHARLELLTSEQLNELAEQFFDFSSAIELETWIAGIEQRQAAYRWHPSAGPSGNKRTTTPSSALLTRFHRSSNHHL